MPRASCLSLCAITRKKKEGEEKKKKATARSHSSAVKHDGALIPPFDLCWGGRGWGGSPGSRGAAGRVSLDVFRASLSCDTLELVPPLHLRRKIVIQQQRKKPVVINSSGGERFLGSDSSRQYQPDVVVLAEATPVSPQDDGSGITASSPHALPPKMPEIGRHVSPVSSPTAPTALVL